MGYICSFLPLVDHLARFTGVCHDWLRVAKRRDSWRSFSINADGFPKRSVPQPADWERLLVKYNFAPLGLQLPTNTTQVHLDLLLEHAAKSVEILDLDEVGRSSPHIGVARAPLRLRHTLCKLTKLRSLVLGMDRNDDIDWANLPPNLTRLDAPHVQLTDAQLQLLCRTSGHLRDLNLGAAKGITDVGLEYAAKSKSLRRLTPPENCSLRPLSGTRLEVLYLSDSHNATLASAADLPLTDLCLSSATDASLALVAHHKLTKLQLDGEVDITPLGLQHLASIHSLTELALVCVPEAATQKLLPAIASLPLRVLKIGPHCDDVDIDRILGRGAVCATHLQELHVHFCAELRLPQHLSHCRRLEDVDLSFCDVDEQHLVALATLPSLRRLGFPSPDDMSPAVIALYRMLHPDVILHWPCCDCCGH